MNDFCRECWSKGTLHDKVFNEYLNRYEPCKFGKEYKQGVFWTCLLYTLERDLFPKLNLNRKDVLVKIKNGQMALSEIKEFVLILAPLSFSEKLIDRWLGDDNARIFQEYQPYVSREI